MDLLQQFKNYISQEGLFNQPGRLLLAVSGGLDSVALCALCKMAGYEFDIAHCNFNLRGEESDRDQKFVEALSKQYGVRFFTRSFDTINYATDHKQSIETTARELRYNWFESLTFENNIDNHSTEKVISTPRFIVTAHHADDNIETVVMNFFRGTGITGLRGILPKHGKLVRPLLFARRSELEAFVHQQSFDYVTDHTNLQNDYTRNYFRNTILPLVTKAYPRADENVLKNTYRMKEAAVLYRQAVELHKKSLLEFKGTEVHIPVLKLAKTVPLITMVYEIIKEYGFTAHQTNEVVGLLKSESGKYVQSATWRIFKNRRWLIISPQQADRPNHILIGENNSEIAFAGGYLSAQKVTSSTQRIDADPSLAQVDLSMLKFPLVLRYWKAGDYFYPLGMPKKKKISRFLSDQKLSVSEKENIMVIEMDKKIVWIVGMRIDDRFKITPLTRQVYALRLHTTGNQSNHALKQIGV